MLWFRGLHICIIVVIIETDKKKNENRNKSFFEKTQK